MIDETEARVREIVKRELAHAYQSGYARGKAEGVKEEREACAKIAEWYFVGEEITRKWDSAVTQITTAIRARSRTGGEHE